MLDQLEQQEVQEQHRLEPRLVTSPAYPVENDQRQRRRMVVALVLLLVALGLVLVKDRDFWFPSNDAAEQDATDDSTPVGSVETVSAAAPTDASAALPATPVVHRRERALTAARVREAAPAPAPPMTPAQTARPVMAPLKVVVEAGGQPQLVKPGSPSVKVVMQPGTAVPEKQETELASIGNAPLTNAGERTQLSGLALSRAVQPEYPLLARQMKVQGQVELQARIGKDGGIQGLDVTAGPTILADAAREAVKQWRFKPYMRDGQAVETQVPITVNFTIRTQ